MNMDLTKNKLVYQTQERLQKVLSTSLDNSKDIKWAHRFLELANHVSGWSKDPSTKVGAVIVNHENRIVSLGYNGFPRGVADCEARYNDRDVKYKFVCHAERNAIDNAYTDVTGCTLYLSSSPESLLPCNECAKTIIQRGIKRVVCKAPTSEKPFMNWDITKIMFQEAGIELILV